MSIKPSGRVPGGLCPPSSVLKGQKLMTEQNELKLQVETKRENIFDSIPQTQALCSPFGCDVGDEEDGNFRSPWSFDYYLHRYFAFIEVKCSFGFEKYHLGGVGPPRIVRWEQPKSGNLKWQCGQSKLNKVPPVQSMVPLTLEERSLDLHFPKTAHRLLYHWYFITTGLSARFFLFFCLSCAFAPWYCPLSLRPLFGEWISFRCYGNIYSSLETYLWAVYRRDCQTSGCSGIPMDACWNADSKAPHSEILIT